MGIKILVKRLSNIFSVRFIPPKEKGRRGINLRRKVITYLDFRSFIQNDSKVDGALYFAKILSG